MSWLTRATPELEDRKRKRSKRSFVRSKRLETAKKRNARTKRRETVLYRRQSKRR